MTLEKVMEQIILNTIRYACQRVRFDENAFAEAMRNASVINDEAEKIICAKCLIIHGCITGKTTKCTSSCIFFLTIFFETRYN